MGIKMGPSHSRCIALVAAVILSGCQTAYYGAMESIGFHKRDILVERIEDARDDQEAAKEQFKSALEEFTEAVGFEGGELKSVYDKLQRELDRSEARAKDVRRSISKVEEVSRALFKEWEQELELYGSEELRRESARKLQDTRARYGQLMRAMRRAESSLDPVLVTFRDQVLFLKHNLNAQAIASLQNKLDSVQSDVARLIQEMESSIAEADAFIGQMDEL